VELRKKQIFCQIEQSDIQQIRVELA